MDCIARLDDGDADAGITTQRVCGGCRATHPGMQDNGTTQIYAFR